MQGNETLVDVAEIGKQPPIIAQQGCNDARFLFVETVQTV